MILVNEKVNVEFLHQLLVKGLGYVPGACWSILRRVHPRSLTVRP